MITDTANRFGKQKIWLLLIGAIVGFNLGVNAGTEESASLQELLREYRTAATDAAGHRGRLLGKLKYLFEQAPLWWRYQIDVAADVADAADTPLLWPKDYRTLYESASRKPYRVSVDCEVPEGGELVIEVPLHPNGRSKLSLVVEDRVKWSTELQTRSRENQPGSELFFLSGPWWHTAELRVEEKGVAVFLGCDDTIVAFLVDIADGDILQELRFGLHEPLAR
ncbi:MAG: hypothetical protein JNM43_22870 [Planctomycetaceae bacterium]|nr:hypothetical protein [Planctomycetaceae bacterium]